VIDILAVHDPSGEIRVVKDHDRSGLAEIEQVQQGSTDEDWYETLGVDFDALFDQMKGYLIIIMAKLKFFFMQVIEFMVITIYQVCSYIIFFVQIIFAADDLHFHAVDKVYGQFVGSRCYKV